VAIVVGGAVVLGASVGAVAYFLSGTGRSATAPAGNRSVAATAGGPDVSVVALGPGVVAASREAGTLPGADARATSDASDPEASAAAQDAVAGPDSAVPSNGPDAPAESAPEAIADAGTLPEAEVPGEPAAGDVGAVEPAVDVAVVAVEPPENGDEEDGGPSVWRLVGLADRAMAQRDFDKARQLYQDVLDIRPGFRRARAGIGKIAFQESEFEEACRYLEPLYAERGNMMLGVIYTRLGRLQDAKRQFERVLRRTPNSVEAQRALEAVNRQLGTP
jgi:hypothetical protein